MDYTNILVNPELQQLAASVHQVTRIIEVKFYSALNDNPSS